MSRSNHHACGRNCIVCFYEPARNKRADAAAEADERELPAELEALKEADLALDEDKLDALEEDSHADCEQCTGYSSHDDDVDLPNPVRGEWWNDGDEPLPDSPCWGCKRGLRRAHVIDPDTGEILQHHLVREGVTVDCIGLNYRMQLLIAELEETEDHDPTQ